MDIKAIEEYVQASQKAYENGILGVLGNRIHVTKELFEELLNEKGDLEVVTRKCSQYPFQANFKRNGITYYSIYTEEQIKNIFGGNIDELITSN
ncbi:hypothetical protein [Bacillus paranthracis]|uniref:hypothetical protein n=1 Tax=Bacillus paranthracis TaxID=2026186 RepID=UPI0013D104A6|nr:hypothetical protein [Bacillus paranthracis]